MGWTYTLTHKYKDKQIFHQGDHDGHVQILGVSVLKGLKKRLLADGYDKLISFLDSLKVVPDGDNDFNFWEMNDEFDAWFHFKYDGDEYTIEKLKKSYRKMGWPETEQNGLEKLPELRDCNYLIDYEKGIIQYTYHKPNYYKTPHVDFTLKYTFDEIDDILPFWEKNRMYYK